MNLYSFLTMLPEVFLALLAMMLMLYGAMRGNKATISTGVMAIVGMVIAGCMMVMPITGAIAPVDGIFHGMVTDDAFGRYVKIMLLIGSGLSIILSWNYMKKQNVLFFEYPVLILFSLLGMMLMVSADNLLALYVGLELQSLSLYILATMRRDDLRSSEAGLKYFILGALSSCLLLYGISLIYGFTGTIDFKELAVAMYGMGTIAPGIMMAIVLMLAGLSFKIAAVPFHMWTPDVYEGAPTPVTAFFASVPKIAALALLARFVFVPMMGVLGAMEQILTFLAIASMILGSFAGLMQVNIKRLLAYSSIANVGYLLVGIVVGGADGIAAMLFYMAVYIIGTLGVFAIILSLRSKDGEVLLISDLSGLSKTYPLRAMVMGILVFSLAGVPPFVGFFGKYFIFLSAVQSGQIFLAIIGVLSSAVAAYYYLRLIKVMYSDEATVTLHDAGGMPIKIIFCVSALLAIILTAVPSTLLNLAHHAGASLFAP